MEPVKRYRLYLCAGPHCTANGCATLQRTLDTELWALGLDAEVDVRASGCQSRCEDAPSITIWPGPFHYSQLTTERLRRIITQHLRDGLPVEELLAPSRFR
ncbi:MAG TPA: (2Fe-2S) ferredoxin domain-containing protein [Roseiflexaceae bacterium]|nr:(2Fe-2S) ferredoxin domain-containing protein [Roseiflexaceae bacterium]HMP41041.1 (2Fe-2S) ferredoxin domain-containing protein [Roseiflexaceae bacterium]